MNKQTQDTTHEALKEIRNGNIEGRRLEVYNTIKKLGECSNSMIARELRLSINRVTGRVNELRNNFKVVGYAKKDICSVTDRMVLFWKVVKDFEEFEDRESRIGVNVNKCFRCGGFVCECEVLE